MAYPTGTSFPPQFPQAPQPSPFAAAPLGGFNRPVGLPPAGGGFGLPPGGFGQPQDAFAQQAAAPQPGFAPPTAGPNGPEGFGDKNASLSGDGWTSKVFSLQGLAAGTAILGSAVLGHRYFAGKWFPWSEAASSAKEGIDKIVPEVASKISAAFKELTPEKHGEFIDQLTGAPEAAHIAKAENLIKSHLEEIEKLSQSGLKELEETYTNFINAFKTPLHNAREGKALTASAATTAKEDFKATHKAFNDKVASQLKTVAPKEVELSTTGEQAATTTGEQAAATTGEQAAATTGEQAATTTGEQAAATTGEQAAATTGEQAAATTGEQAAATTGEQAAATSPTTIAKVENLEAKTQGILNRLPETLEGIRKSAYKAGSLQGTKVASSKLNSVFTKLETQLKNFKLAENEQNALDNIKQAHKKLIATKEQHLQDPVKNPFDKESLDKDITTANESFKTEISSKLPKDDIDQTRSPWNPLNWLT
jgi:hypothetical protein